MASQQELDEAYMGCAIAISKLSKAKRAQVGAIIVAKSGGIIAEGYNGTYSGASNECEDSDGKTKPIVVHAEANAIYKLARSTNSSKDATLYITMSPCFSCALAIISAGITRVVYKKVYPGTEEAVSLLNRAKIALKLCLSDK